MYNDELSLNSIETTLEKWRRLSLKALEEAKLLSRYALTPTSSAEALVERLEVAAMTEGSGDAALRKCLSGVNYA